MNIMMEELDNEEGNQNKNNRERRWLNIRTYIQV